MIKKRILILGGCGYIGSALFRHFSTRWHNEQVAHFQFPTYHVDTVDLEWFGNFVNPRNIQQDYNELTEEFYKDYDIVILLSAYSSPAICQNSGYPSVIANNVANFVNILPKLRNGQKFIYASSITVYNGNSNQSIEEDSPLIIQPMNSYDFSKQDCDRIMQDYPGVEFYGLRLATVCGISENWRNDIMINSMTDNALMTSEIKVFNPKNSKPILYIRDLVRAVDAIINCESDHRGFYNLASFNGITEEIAEVVADVTNSNLRVLSASEMEKLKLPTTGYDFNISTQKFQETFNFTFLGTAEHITKEIARTLLHNDGNFHKGKRVDGIRYI